MKYASYALLLLLTTMHLCSDSQPLVYSDESLDDLLADLVVDIVPAEIWQSSSFDFVIPGIGPVALAAGIKEDGTSYMEGHFPQKDNPLLIGPVEITEGLFELLPDGAVRYSGRGTIGEYPVDVGLARFQFLTPEEKKRIDAEYQKAEEKSSKKSSKKSKASTSEADAKLHLLDGFAVQEAVFSLSSPSGFISLSCGDWLLFKFTRAELVVGYRKAPSIRFFTSIAGQPVEVRVSAQVSKPNFQLSFTTKEVDPIALIPGAADLFKGLPLENARFSGSVEFDARKGLVFSGFLSDAQGENGWNISPISDQSVILDSLMLSLDPQGAVLEAQGNAFGSGIVFSGSLDRDSGLTVSGALAAASIDTYLPWLPRDIFEGLSVVGAVTWSSKKGLELSGQLTTASGQLNLLGVVLKAAQIDVNLAQKSLLVTGLFSVFDLDAKARVSLSVGEERVLSCSAELVEPSYGESWKPPALSDYLSGKGDLQPFAFKKISLVAGVESKKHPVKALKTALKEYKENKENRIVLADSTKPKLFFAVAGEAIIMGQVCRAIAKVQKNEKFGFIIGAEPIEEFSLARAFPDVFAHTQDDNVVFQYLKNVVGGLAFSDVALILSTLTDVDAGIRPGLNITGSVAYAGDPRENPLFAPFFSGTSADLFQFKKDGDRGIGISMVGLVDPINFKNTVIKFDLGSGDYGLFLNLPNVEEVGFKKLSIGVEFFPLKPEAGIKAKCLYVAKQMEQSLNLWLDAGADFAGIGGSFGGEGDFDAAVYLPLLMGRGIRDVLSQRIILRNGGFAFKTTWAALASLVEAVVGGIPTLGVGTVAGILVFLVTSIDTLGFSGAFEIGQHDDPLQGGLVFKGGTDVSEVVIELLGEKPGGFTSLVCFLFDMLLYFATLGHKEIILPDMRVVQDQISKIVPLDLEKFYLKIVPLGTRIGEIVIPSGVGGSLWLKLFGTSVGADLMLDSQGGYACAYVDPIDLWGLYRLRPSKTLGTVAKEIEEKNAAWGVATKDRKDLQAFRFEKQKKITVEASAHLEKGFNLETDFDVEIADFIGGSIRARLGLAGLDLQGDLRVKIPELAQMVGVKDGGFQLWVKGTQIDLDNPLRLLNQLSPQNIGLEVGLHDGLREAVFGTVENVIKGIEDQINTIVSSFVDAALTKPKLKEKYRLEYLQKEVCEKAKVDPNFAAKCGEVAAELALLQAKDYVLDRLDDAGLGALPDTLKNTIITLRDLGVGVLRGGRFVVAGAHKLFSIKEIVWRGSLQDLSTGKIPGFDVTITFLGTEIILPKVGTFDFKKSPSEWIKQLSLDVAQVMVQRMFALFDGVSPQSIQEILGKLVA